MPGPVPEPEERTDDKVQPWPFKSPMGRQQVSPYEHTSKHGGTCQYFHHFCHVLATHTCISIHTHRCLLALLTNTYLPHHEKIAIHPIWWINIHYIHMAKCIILNGWIPQGDLFLQNVKGSWKPSIMTTEKKAFSKWIMSSHMLTRKDISVVNNSRRMWPSCIKVCPLLVSQIVWNIYHIFIALA